MRCSPALTSIRTMLTILSNPRVRSANEAALILPAPGAVQIVAVGATPEASALLRASVVTCTAPELLALLQSETNGNVAGVVDAVLSAVSVLVLDELDMLLPVAPTYGPRAAQRKRQENKKAESPPAEELIRLVLEAAALPTLQVLAASATVSRPTRLKLARVLRRDPVGRWYDQPPEIVRPSELAVADLSAVPRAIVVPSTIRTPPHWPCPPPQAPHHLPTNSPPPPLRLQTGPANCLRRPPMFSCSSSSRRGCMLMPLARGRRRRSLLHAAHLGGQAQARHSQTRRAACHQAPPHAQAKAGGQAPSPEGVAWT